MLEQVGVFQLDGKLLLCTPYGNGHINQTYLLVDDTGREYILQKINRQVFKNPEALMQNILAVIEHIRQSAKGAREVLSLIPTKDGNYWFCDSAGEYWRMYGFITDSLCLQQAQSAGDFYESGVAFGRFQRQLADFAAKTLTETIPDFHDTPKRLLAFKKAVAEDCCGRAKDVQREIAFVLERAEYTKTLQTRLQQGGLPLRVTHNDTKLNNVLFDRETRKPLCVIDLDTVMPGLSVNDFGDSIRFGASTAVEDEPDLNKVHLSLPYFAAYTEGFLSACGSSLTLCEIESLCDGAKMMTLECGMRFLADYLMGDVYFRVHRENHNLDRCRTQFKLVADMERYWNDMQAIVLKEAEKWRSL